MNINGIEYAPVPVEPTSGMLTAGMVAISKAPDLHGIVSPNTAESYDCYQAMLAAAPKLVGEVQGWRDLTNDECRWIYAEWVRSEETAAGLFQRFKKAAMTSQSTKVAVTGSDSTAAQPASHQKTDAGCSYCTHPLYAGTKCKVCGRVSHQKTDEAAKWYEQEGGLGDGHC